MWRGEGVDDTPVKLSTTNLVLNLSRAATPNKNILVMGGLRNASRTLRNAIPNLINLPREQTQAESDNPPHRNPSLTQQGPGQ